MRPIARSSARRVSGSVLRRRTTITPAATTAPAAAPPPARTANCPAPCSSAPVAAIADDDVITLGASLQSTGSQANTGRYYVDAYKLAVDTINAKGGVKVGDKTYKLALKLYDTQRHSVSYATLRNSTL